MSQESKKKRNDSTKRNQKDHQEGPKMGELIWSYATNNQKKGALHKAPETKGTKEQRQHTTQRKRLRLACRQNYKNKRAGRATLPVRTKKLYKKSGAQVQRSLLIAKEHEKKQSQQQTGVNSRNKQKKERGTWGGHCTGTLQLFLWSDRQNRPPNQQQTRPKTRGQIETPVEHWCNSPAQNPHTSTAQD